ncbi:MAG: hypothetical protein S4CHLAM6_01970 [Chlamydiae bacterium]|nr:hypothetical protein [Chlamydiota bacterium]
MVNEIENIYSCIESELIKNRLRADIENPLSQTLALIPLLTGTQMEITNEQTFPWTHDKGCLNKLRYYCFLFGQKNIENPDAVKMNICISKAFHSALQLREVILSLQHQISEGKVPNYVSLYQLLDKLIDNMRLASRLILKVLVQYKDNENLLHFLLKNQKDFDAVYETKFVAKVFKKMYPEGLKYAKDLIVEKYVKRGFGHLIGFISKQMAILEASETPKATL